MAIQMRRGLKADLDKSKLVAGEIVVKTDAREVGVTIAPSDVVDLATKEDIGGKQDTLVIGADGFIQL